MLAAMIKKIAIPLICLLSFAVITHAQDTPAATAPTTPPVPAATPPPATTPAPAAAPTPAAEPEGHSTLPGSMKKIAKALKALKLDLKTPVDANKADYVALVATIKAGVSDSRDQVPNKADGLPADQKATMVTAYQKAIDDLLKTVDTLNDDVTKGQWDAANKDIDSLLAQEKDGHEAFRKKEK